LILPEFPGSVRLKTLAKSAAQKSSAGDLSAVAVRAAETGGETPPQPAGRGRLRHGTPPRWL